MTGDPLDRTKTEIKQAAHFYMAHRMREYPNQYDSEITMHEHVSGDQDCPGCHAEDLLDALVEIARAARAYTEGKGTIRQIKAALARLDGER